MNLRKAVFIICGVAAYVLALLFVLGDPYLFTSMFTYWDVDDRFFYLIGLCSTVFVSLMAEDMTS